MFHANILELFYLCSSNVKLEQMMLANIVSAKWNADYIIQVDKHHSSSLPLLLIAFNE